MEEIITLEDFMKSPYNNILNAPVILDVDGERIEVTEEVSTPEFFKKYEFYQIVEIRPTLLPPHKDDIEEISDLAEVDVHFELGFVVVLEKYLEENKDYDGDRTEIDS